MLEIRYCLSIRQDTAEIGYIQLFVIYIEIHVLVTLLLDDKRRVDSSKYQQFLNCFSKNT